MNKAKSLSKIKKVTKVLAIGLIPVFASIVLSSCIDNYKYVTRKEDFQYIDESKFEYNPNVFKNINSSELNDEF